jgi:glyoxylase-like metal-dependent hydrolase (beta-lactamase superfamily II)
MALAISSEGEQLLCISDAMLHPIHIEQPDWYALIDCIPEQTVGTRHRILRLATSREALVMGFHFSFPGLGRIIEKGDGWRWEPVSTRKSSSR